ncbi:MAG: hypothetical protein K5986_00700 [Clostridium sp.]|uniref:hypothetical protein n=1 Tax=Clostridium sp. DSM 8431 TaxID=1761781 RepID=UPI0008ED0E14|nr:hypothetical protein [Clostridium sp. DSM 8431]MCR4942995.1 hypothetical protein [Clostridium sp.]SFU46513.1 hypothetical protein SAMN04487886_103411 [Clostridium sp. DSM 8431]
MKLFLVEGNYKNPIPLGGLKLDNLMKKYLDIIREETKDERILFFGMKKDLTGTLLIMKGKDIEEIEKVTKSDLLYKKHILVYNIKEFICKEYNEKFNDWFSI